MAVKVDIKHLADFIKFEEYEAISPQAILAQRQLHDGTGTGSDFLGWVDYPLDYDRDEIERIKVAAKYIKNNADILIVIGIGGSYLGARAAVEFLNSPFYNETCSDTPKIYYAGNNISPDYLNTIASLCEGKDIAVNIISKSGTTTEPAIAFRYFRNLLIDKYGIDGAKKRIFATTDKARGTLKTLADAEGYETFVIEDNVGGRFSVLTPVGLLPVAVSGGNIDELLAGAAAAHSDFMSESIVDNHCLKYAAIRSILYAKGFQVELLASYHPNFKEMSEWFKQLFGESEGKDGKGLFPASVIFSTDLHSLGQYIQDGRVKMFETVVDVKNNNTTFEVNKEAEDFDGLNYLAGKDMSFVNRKAMEGTILAHTKEGGVPNIMLEIEDFSENELGYLIYFFEKACAISGYMLGVNPFDQPGVESYKRNMFALLGKPGFEELAEELKKL